MKNWLSLPKLGLIYPVLCFVFFCLTTQQTIAAVAVQADIKSAEEKSGLKWQTITSLTSDSKYLNDFKHYSYVNPNAPKGGRLNKIIVGNFNSLNPYIVEGQAPFGLMPFGGGFLYDNLMDQSLEEPGVSYPALAEAIQYPKDNSWVKFRLNPNAKWHDGQPITADDVIWSFHVLRKTSAYYASYYAQVEKAEKINARELKFSFKAKGNRELPKIMGDLAVLPRHWWQAKDKNGKQRDITKPTLEIPLGSGPYRIEKVEPGKYIQWKREPKAWGNNLPQNIGRNNYDTMRFSYMLDGNAEWEAFKKGGLSDYRTETIISKWENNYNLNSVKQGAMVKRTLPYFGGVYQGYYFNTRRAKFADKRVRKALSLALNFQVINKALFYDKYERSTSYYGTLLPKSQTSPQGDVLELLQKMHSKYPHAVPQQALYEKFSLPIYKTKGDTRQYLAEAMQLLQEAGWHLQDNQLVDSKGQPLTIELLFSSAVMERPAAFYIANLRKLGINATMRVVDSSQYTNRVNNFDYDIIMASTVQSYSPGNEQGEYFASQSINRKGGRNYAGINNPAIDALIAQLMQAKNQKEVINIAQAIDTILLWNYYSIPSWRNPHLFLAYWDKFGVPPTQPAHAIVDIYSWWVDKDKLQNLKKMGYTGFQ